MEYLHSSGTPHAHPSKNVRKNCKMCTDPRALILPVSETRRGGLSVTASSLCCGRTSESATRY